jgi:signal transduction histidine kinase
MNRSGWFVLVVLLLLFDAIGIILALIYPSQVSFPGFVAVYTILILGLPILLVALHRAQTLAAGSSRQLEAIQRLTVALSGSRDPEESLVCALDTVLELTHTAAIRLWLANPETRTLKFRLHRGLFPEIFSQAPQVGFDDLPSGRAAAAKQSVLLTGLLELPALRAKGFVEFLSVPLCAHAGVVGVLDVAARHRGELDAAALQLLSSSSHSIALAVLNAERVSDAERRATEFRRLWQAGMEVSAAPDYMQTLRAVVDRARELIQGEASALCIWDEQKQWWTVQGASGASDAFDLSVKRVVTPTRTLECPIIRFKYHQSHLDVPVLHGDRVVGCLCIATQTGREFSAREHDLLVDMANQAGIAIDRARREERVGERAVVTERERLAREMHDTLAQLLGFVSFKTQAAREFLAQGRTDHAIGQLDQLMTISQELYADTRELILGLNSKSGPDRELVPALDDYIRRFSQLSGITTTFEPDGIEGARLAPLTEVQLIRVVQEALSNVRKHAQAGHAQVRFERADEFARVTVEDDGQGFDLAQVARGQWPRFGMQSMRERVESVGGTMSVRSVQGQGTKVTVQIPIVYRGAE